MKMNKTREELKKFFLESLKEDKMSWYAGFYQIGNAKNIVTEKTYRGNNFLLLSLIAKEKGYERNEWCTFKQAKEKGYKINKGAKGVPVEFFSLYDKKEKKIISPKDYEEKIIDLSPNEKKERIKVINKISYVFNVCDMENVNFKEFKKNPKVHLNVVISNLIKNMNIEVKKGISCFYEIKKDCITMVDKLLFESQEAYNQTLLHEICHATGHEKRLDREFGKKLQSKEERAKEELRAEIAATFLASDIPNIFNEKLLNNSKAYVQSWSELINNDEKELFNAVKEAEKIYDYVKENGIVKELENEKKYIKKEKNQSLEL